MADAAKAAIPNTASIPAAPNLTLTRTSAATVNSGNTHIYELTTDQKTVDLSLSDGGAAPFLCDSSGNPVSNPNVTITATSFTDSSLNGTQSYHVCLTRAAATSVTLSAAAPDTSGQSFNPHSPDQLNHQGEACQGFLPISSFKHQVSADAAWIPSSADLSITKTANTTNAKRGELVEYTITVTNTGSDAATGIIVHDQLPAGIKYTSDTPSQGSYDVTTGKWTVGSLVSGASATLVIAVQVD